MATLPPAVYMESKFFKVHCWPRDAEPIFTLYTCPQWRICEVEIDSELPGVSDLLLKLVWLRPLWNVKKDPKFR
jgi:hypothetical protein